MAAQAPITLWHDGSIWNASSQDPYQGSVGGSAEVVLDTVVGWMDERVLVAPDSFMGLVRVAQAMLDEHYPADIFAGRNHLDSGVRFVTRLRDALAQVHADHPRP